MQSLLQSTKTTQFLQVVNKIPSLSITAAKPRPPNTIGQRKSLRIYKHSEITHVIKLSTTLKIDLNIQWLKRDYMSVLDF